MLVLLILAALAAPHATVDRTLSCPVYPEGAAHIIAAQGSVTTPRGGAFLQFWPTPLAYDEPAVLPGVEIDTQPGKIVWDPRGRCEPANARIPLVPHGLKLDSVVTTHFLGSVDARCRAGQRVRFRARVTVAHGVPTRAQLIAVTSKPVLYAEWTPVRIAVWIGPGCST